MIAQGRVVRVDRPIARILIAILLVCASTLSCAEDGAPAVETQLQKVLADIDQLGPDKFNPCKTPTRQDKPNCKPGGEYVLWTSFDSDADLKAREKLPADQISVGYTPGGVLAVQELGKVKAEWEKEIVVWERLSRDFALNLLKTQSRVTLHVGGYKTAPNPKSIFCRVELPTILSNKPDLVILISSRNEKYAVYTGKRITAPSQWPCGKAEPIAYSETDKASDHKDTVADNAGHFEKRVGKSQLKDPARAWSQLLGTIQSSPIIARLASLTAKHLGDNQFSFHSSLDVAGRTLGYSGNMRLNPQAQNNELLLKVEAKLSAGKFALGALEATGAKLDLVVVNESGAGRVYARIRPDLTIKDKTIPAVVQFGTADAGKGLSYDVDLGKNVSLIDLVPSVANVRSLKSSLVGDMKILKDSYHISGVLAGKHFGLTVGVQKLGDFEITSDDLKLSDLVEQAKTLRVFENYAFEKLAHAGRSVTIAGTINKKQVTVTYDNTAGKSLTAQGEGLALSDFVPEAQGLKAFDKVTLSLVSISPKQFEVDGELAGKKIRFVKSLVGKSAVSVTTDDLRASDVFSSLKSVPGLDVVAVEKIDLHPEYIDVQVLLNGEKVALVSHTGKNNKRDYIAVYLEKLSAATFIPAANGHWMNEVELDKALFIIQPGNATPQSIAGNDLPGQLGQLAGLRADEKLDIRPGLNLSARLNVARSRRLSDMFKTVGLKSGSLPLRGTLSAATFKSLAGKGKERNATVSSADKTSILEGLALTVDLPAPSIPSVAHFVKVTGPTRLSIGGTPQGTGIWSRLPKSLSASRSKDGLDVSIQFGVQLTGANLNEQLDAVVDIGSGNHKSLSLLVLSHGQWKSPFGVTALTLKSGGFRFALESENSASKKELAFFGVADLGSHPDVEVSADFSTSQGKLKLNYFALDGKFSLRDVPGGSAIPHAEQFELDEIKLSGRGVEARTRLAGKQVNAFLFEQSSNNWVFAIDQRNFKFAEILPVVRKIRPLDNITLPRAALIISKDGLRGKRGDMSEIAQDMLRDIFGKSNVEVNIPGGIGLLAAFDEHHMGVVGQGLKRIGVHDDAILMGELTGIFQGNPGILLSLMMEKSGSPTGIPRKVVSVPRNASPQFFIQWSGTDFYVGAGLGMDVKAGKDILRMAGKIELEFNEKGVGVDILGEMDGHWRNPFGIKGVTLSDTKLKIGINDIGEVLVGFAGHDRIGKEDVQFAAEMKILLEDALPDGVAFSGSMNNLGADAMLDIADTLMGAKGKLTKVKVPYFEIHGATIAFATPGATDPQLGLMKAGFAFGGQFFFLNRKLGMVKGIGTVTDGIQLQGVISDIDLEVLKLQNNKIDLAINFHPKFALDSNAQLLGGSHSIHTDVQPSHLEFSIKEQLGELGEADLRIRIDGLDLAKGTYFSKSDISVVGAFKSNLAPWMQEEIRKGIDELHRSATARLNANLNAVNQAEAKVRQLDRQILEARNSLHRGNSRNSINLASVERRVATLKRDYDHAASESRTCGDHWSHWACSEYWKTQATSINVVYRASADALAAIKATEAAAFDYDPRVIELVVERDAAHAALSVAKAVFDSAKAASDFVQNRLEQALAAKLDHLPFEVQQAIVIGDLRDMIKRDAPMVMDMKYKMMGSPMRNYFALKLRDPKFNAVSFALLPAMAMERLASVELKKFSPAVERWVHAHIARKLVQAEAAVRKQVAGEEKRYADILKSFEIAREPFQKSYAAQAQLHVASVTRTEVSDLFGGSAQFTNASLAAGHSSLCVGADKNGRDVIQDSCQSLQNTKWTTQKAADGYVQLLNNRRCLKAEKPNAAKETPLVLANCNARDPHELWKVIAADGSYFRVVNRFSQKCLHFDSENANPKSARAVWSSCVGTDSQAFRFVQGLEVPAWHDVRYQLKVDQGCLAFNHQSTLGAPVGALQRRIAAGLLTLTQYRQLQQQKRNILEAKDCRSVRDVFNYVQQPGQHIKLVHADTGWCVRPNGNRDRRLVIGPCDRGKDMEWIPVSGRSNAWNWKNVASQFCLSAPKLLGLNSTPQARIASCTAMAAKPYQSLTPAKSNNKGRHIQ